MEVRRPRLVSPALPSSAASSCLSVFLSLCLSACCSYVRVLLLSGVVVMFRE
jgi:hypothetical protein